MNSMQAQMGQADAGLSAALVQHWPEYLMEAAGLGFFMISACLFGTLLEHPSSGLHRLIPDAMMRRGLMGLAMGLTAVAILYSPWGQRSGAHINPAVTLTFYRLGKIARADTIFYVLAQFAGGLAGVYLCALLLGARLDDPAVKYVATLPGERGVGAAFAAEAVISFVLMFVILNVSNNRSISRYTPLFAGALVATYIFVEAPVSGMSMNPARTFASALPARMWTALWVYFTAPPLGMLLAAQTYLKLRGASAVRCAKLHHDNPMRCIFRCNY